MQKHYSKHAKGGNSPTETYLQSCSTYAHSTWFSFVLCYRKQNFHVMPVKLSSKGHYHLHFLYSVVFSFPIPLLGQTTAPVRCLSGQTPRCSYCSNSFALKHYKYVLLLSSPNPFFIQLS